MARRPSTARGASVTVLTRPMWRIRVARELPRYVLSAAAVAGLAASARYAIAPPSAGNSQVPALSAPPRDLAAEGYALLFARRYLSWSALNPEASARALGPFAGVGVEPGLGLQLPAGGEQQVTWAGVVQERAPSARHRVYTVAAQTDTAGLLYLSVPVVRTPSGIALGGYPAFVGPPGAAPAQLQEHLQEVGDQSLVTVVARALRNYIAGATSELAADLAPGARVSAPSMSLALDALARLDWSPDRRSVLAVIQAHDGRGVRYLLAYELDVAREQGRWEIGAVQMDPDA